MDADAGLCEGLSWLVVEFFGLERFANFSIYVSAQWLTGAGAENHQGVWDIFLFYFYSNNFTNLESD